MTQSKRATQAGVLAFFVAVAAACGGTATTSPQPDETSPQPSANQCPGVCGEVTLGGGAVTVYPGVSILRVALVDTTNIDDASITLAEVTRQVDELPAEFELAVGDVDIRDDFRIGLRAHWDMNGDGEVDVGDSINDTFVPVLTQGNPTEDIVIELIDVR